MTRDRRKRAIRSPKGKVFRHMSEGDSLAVSARLLYFEHMVFESGTAHNYVEFIYGHPKPTAPKMPPIICSYMHTYVCMYMFYSLLNKSASE